MYRNIAEQHSHKYIELPPQINLGSPEYKEFYKKVKVVLANGEWVVRKPIVYGITISKKCKE